VDDLRRLGVEGSTLRRVERVARLLHQLVETLALLAADPVFAVEAVGMPEPPEAAVGIEQRRLRIAQEQAIGRNGALVEHALPCAHLHHLDPGANPGLAPHVGDRLEQELVVVPLPA